MKLPNKGGPAPAEAVEGRSRTKENVEQSRTSPTQSGERVSQGLSGVRPAARERRQEQFNNLLHHLTTGLLRDSFYALKREAAAGVDGVRWREYREYEEGLEDRLIDLHSRVHPLCAKRERIGHNPRGECIYGRTMAGSGRWASRRWRTK